MEHMASGLRHKMSSSLLVVVAVTGLALGQSGPVAASAATVPPRTVWVAGGGAGGGLGMMTPIDVATDTPGAGVPIPASDTGIAISPNARTAYVSNAEDSSLAKVDTVTQTTDGEIGVGTCGKLAISPDGTEAWVASSCGDSSTAAGAVRIDLVTGSQMGIVFDSGVTFDVVIAPNGSTVYLAVNAGGSKLGVVPVAAATGALGTLIPVSPGHMAITPNGARLIVVGSERVTRIDTSTRTPGAPLVLAGARDVAITPDGRTAWVTANAGLVPLDVRTGHLGRPIPVAGATEVAITPGGTHAYVLTQPGLVVPVNLATRVAENPIPLGGEVLAITPSQAPRADFTFTTARHGSPTVFDASRSVARNGRIAHYRWRFGDGTTAITSSPRIGHIYARSAHYTVTLTVTDLAGTTTTKVFTGHTMLRNGGPSARNTRTLLIP